MQERRKYPRIDLDIDVFVSPVEGECISGESKDVSENGFSFRCSHQFQKGTTINLILKPKKIKDKFKFQGKVVWAKAIEGTNLYITGVELINLHLSSGTEFLARYLDRICSFLGGHLHL